MTDLARSAQHLAEPPQQAPDRLTEDAEYRHIVMIKHLPHELLRCHTMRAPNSPLVYLR